MKNKDKKGKEDAECDGESCPINGPANGGKDYGSEYGDELLASITGEDQPDVPELPKLRDLLPKKLLIRDRCLQLGYMIGPLTSKMDKKKRNLEVGGFFLVDKDDDSFAFQDFIIPKGLPVSEGSIYVAEQYDKAAREVKERNQENKTSLRLGAMFHVHPFKGGLYHSPDDDKALESLLNKLAKTTRKVHESPYALIQDKLRKEYGDKALCLKGDVLSDAVQKFIYPNDALFFKMLREFGLKPDAAHFKKKDFLARLLDIIGKETYEPRLVNFAVSFVFNNDDGGPYVKMGAQEKFVLTGKESSAYIEDIPLKILDEGVDIPSEAEIKDLIKERVIFPAKTKWVSMAASKFYSGSSAIAKSVAERIASLVVPEAAEGTEAADATAESSESGAPDNAVLESIVTGGDVVTSAPKKAKMPDNQVAKTASQLYDYGEISALFIMAANSYIACYRHVACRYSTYMSAVLDLLQKYRYAYYGSGYGYGHTSRVKNKDLPGIRTAVEQTGQLVGDNPQVVETHSLDTYRISDSIENTLDELLDLQDSESAEFMLAFAVAKDLEEKNKLLEIYVAKVLSAKEESLKKESSAKGSKAEAGSADTHISVSTEPHEDDGESKAGPPDASGSIYDQFEDRRSRRPNGTQDIPPGDGSNSGFIYWD